ncbi:hypothetical protein [Bosea beijingensis]|nr:hypothetical protein [Bosea sp. REN20]
MKAGNLGRIGRGINRKFNSVGAINSDLAGFDGFQDAKNWPGMQ